MQFDSVGFAVETAKDLAAPLPTPPQHLEDHALKYWAPIINSKRRSAWSESDLVQACVLARAYSAIDILSEDLERDGYTLVDKNEKVYAHPAAKLLDAATRCAVTLARSLQVHASATQGRTAEQRGKNEKAREIGQTMTAASSLIARPGASH